MSKKATMKTNFVHRTTKKDKKKNTENKYGKFTHRHVRKVEKYKKKMIKTNCNKYFLSFLNIFFYHKYPNKNHNRANQMIYF